MQIMLNDKPLQVSANSTVSHLLQQQQLKPEGLAVAINNIVIAKRQWNEQQLQHNDCVSLFHIVTGG